MIFLGLSCLHVCLCLHKTVYESLAIADPTGKDLEISFRGIYDIKTSLRWFLFSIFEDIFRRDSHTEPKDLLRGFYCILILSLIRYTLRSVLRCDEYGYRACGPQVQQDLDVERGLCSELYLPTLFVLETSKATISQIMQNLESETCTQYVLASALVPIPQPKDATLLQHITFFFGELFPSNNYHASSQPTTLDYPPTPPHRTPISNISNATSSSLFQPPFPPMIKSTSMSKNEDINPYAMDSHSVLNVSQI